ncbi:MAG: hypothetical protein KF841_10640 [Phycisphaerae bacterium]|nr:hypothetical protein [Phycisphaerae bacterium]
MTQTASARRAIQFALILTALVWLLPGLGRQLVQAQIPHAVDPLRNPLFSIDLLSPTASTEGVSASDVLDKPGPSVRFSAQGLRLNSPLDNLNALSSDRSDLTTAGTAGTFAILFSVDRLSVGAADPDPDLVASNRPFNVREQAMKNQAAADLFMSTLLFDLNGPIVPPLRGPGGGNNTGVINQGDAGGVDYDLKPTKAPSKNTPPPPEPKDDVDAAVSQESGGGGPMRGISTDGIFFSVSRNSPSLQNLPGTPSGANVYFDFEPSIPMGEIIYARADQLGLISGPGGDDIDGLVVIDHGDRILNPATDRIFFTLTRGSPTLATSPDFSAADIFVSNGSGSFVRFAEAADLGLGPNDHIDALEVLVTDDIEDAIFRHALLRILPGDFDGNGILDQIDCDHFHTCFSGDGVTFDTNGTATTNISVGPGSSFNPADIVVETGDTVLWTWVDGPHNVVSGSGGVFDGAFFSGAPTSNAGTVFQVLFDDSFLNLHPRGGSNYSYFSQPDQSAGMTGTVAVVPHPCATFDMDFDGDVDCADWLDFANLYLQFSSTLCVPLTIPEFVDALLMMPQQPWHACAADVNLDGFTDGRDIRPYVDAYLAAP